MADAAHNVAWDCAVRGDREAFEALIRALGGMPRNKAALAAAHKAWRRFA